MEPSWNSVCHWRCCSACWWQAHEAHWRSSGEEMRLNSSLEFMKTPRTFTAAGSVDDLHCTCGSQWQEHAACYPK